MAAVAQSPVLEIAALARDIVGPDWVVTDGAQLRVYECDGLKNQREVPGAVVLPGTTEQVAAVVRLCHERGVPFVARGAGSGLSGGAMPTAAGGPDQFELQGRRVTRSTGRLSLDDGTLAGSDLTMDAAVRHCVEALNLDLATVLRMASLNPASFLRCEHELGRIAPGYLASMVLLGDNLQVKQTWIDGQ